MHLLEAIVTNVLESNRNILGTALQATTINGTTKAEGVKKKIMELPADCPSQTAQLFDACTQLDPRQRPSAAQIVEYLRDVNGRN